MKIKSILKVVALSLAATWFAQSASAETVLKLGTVGFKGMPIGDAIDQALIPTLEKVSAGKMTVEPHYRKSLCSEQSCGEQANQGLIALWTSSTANFGNFGTSLAVFDLPFIFKSIEDADRISSNWLAKSNVTLLLKKLATFA